MKRKRVEEKISIKEERVATQEKIRNIGSRKGGDNI